MTERRREGVAVSDEAEVTAFLADALPVETYSLIGEFGGVEARDGRPAAYFVLRVPGFYEEGVPGSEGLRHSSLETQWSMIRDEEDILGILLMEWPNGQTRKLRFDLRSSAATFIPMLMETATHGIASFGITDAPGGELFDVTMVEIDLNDGMYLTLCALFAWLADGGEP